MTTADQINERIKLALKAACQANEGCNGIFLIRIWLQPETIAILMQRTYRPHSTTVIHYGGIPVAKCLPGDPGERIIDINGNAYLIPQEA